MSDPCGPYNWPFNPNQYSELTAFLEFLLLYSLLCCPLPSGRPKLYRDPGDQVVGLPYRVRMSLIYSFLFLNMPPSTNQCCPIKPYI